MPILSPRPLVARKQPRSLIDVSLDANQREAAHRPRGSAMLVLGEAGHGKTTVLLHRLAHLYKAATRRFRARVIVPSEGLRRLLQPIVVRLGADVEVVTYHHFALGQARRVFGDMPRREANSTSVGVSRIKRDPALRPVLDELAARPPGRIDDDEDAPPPKTKAHAHRGDLQHLFGDQVLMERVARHSAQGIAANAVSEILEHTFVQFSARSEQAYAHVDGERLVAADALELDAGTPFDDAGSIDVEDYAVLFELDRLRAARLGDEPTKPPAFGCIVLDEAQEFAPIELALVGRSLAPGGTLVVGGDADQQTDPTVCFDAWPATMHELGAAAYEEVVLDVGYRCPPAVVTFARAVREGRCHERLEVPLLRFDDEHGLIEWLLQEAIEIERRDPSAMVCIVTRRPLLARRLAAALKGKTPCRLVLDGQFAFHRGVDVTTIEQVKGLEFDHVILADVCEAEYPETAAARRALYVGATRARHQLVLACVGEPSPLVRSSAVDRRVV